MAKINVFLIFSLFGCCISMANPIKILFIGNSFTHMNNFSDMLSIIAYENCNNIITDFAAIDSYTLEKHYSDNATISKINSDKWDFVVLQEQSQRPIMDSSAIFYEKTLKYAKALSKVVYQNNPTTQILLFETWGRKYGDTELCSKYQWTCTYEDMQAKIIERYKLLGEMMNVSVVPCGEVWLQFAPNSPNHINLFHIDNKHPNEAGSYLNACVFYVYLTKKLSDADTYNPTGLSQEELLKLQLKAYEVVMSQDDNR